MCCAWRVNRFLSIKPISPNRNCAKAVLRTKDFSDSALFDLNHIAKSGTLYGPTSKPTANWRASQIVNLSKWGKVEIARRIITLAMGSYALVSIGSHSWPATVVTLVLAVAIYSGIPRRKITKDILVYERMPAVVGPDILGFLLTGLFIALPFWARTGDESYWKDFGWLIHPASLLTWPLATISALILLVATQKAVFRLTIRPSGITVSNLKGDQELLYSSIASVTPFRLGLPAFFKWLTPLLVLTGRYSAAGAILMARDDTGMCIAYHNGSHQNISEHGFEKPFASILLAFHEAGVKLDPLFERRLSSKK